MKQIESERIPISEAGYNSIICAYYFSGNKETARKYFLEALKLEIVLPSSTILTLLNIYKDMPKMPVDELLFVTEQLKKTKEKDAQELRPKPSDKREIDDFVDDSEGEELDDKIEEFILSQDNPDSDLESLEYDFEDKVLSPSIYKRLIFLFSQCRQSKKAEELLMEYEKYHAKADPQQTLVLRVAIEFSKSLSLQDPLKWIEKSTESGKLSGEKALYSLLMSCSQQEKFSEAIKILETLKHSNSRLTVSAISQILTFAVTKRNKKVVEEMLELLNEFSEHNEDLKIYVSTMILFGKRKQWSNCSFLYDCCIEFANANKEKSNLVRDTSFFNAFLSSCIHFDKFELLNSTIKQMEERGMKKDNVTFLILLKGYSSKRRDVQKLEYYMKKMNEEGFPLSQQITRHIITCYKYKGHFDKVIEYENMFLSNLNNNVSLSNLVQAYFAVGKPEKALESWKKLVSQGFSPRPTAVKSLIVYYAQQGSFFECFEIVHKIIFSYKFPINATLSSMVLNITPPNFVEHVLQVFEEQGWNVPYMNIMIAKLGKFDFSYCEKYYNLGVKKGRVNQFSTYDVVLKNALRFDLKEQVSKYFSLACQTVPFTKEQMIHLSWVDLYLGDKNGLYKRLERLHSREKTATLVNAFKFIIVTLSRGGNAYRALQFFDLMKSEYKLRPNFNIVANLIYVTSIQGMKEEATKIMEFVSPLRSKFPPLMFATEGCYELLLGNPQKALQCLEEVRNREKNETTPYLKETRNQMVSKLCLDLLNYYVKRNEIFQVEALKKKFLAWNEINLEIANALLKHYHNNKNLKQIEEFIVQMSSKKIQPDALSFSYAFSLLGREDVSGIVSALEAMVQCGVICDDIDHPLSLSLRPHVDDKQIYFKMKKTLNALKDEHPFKTTLIFNLLEMISKDLLQKTIDSK